jgi:signal transduction histidine kinase
MEDLSLHILDIVENAISADAGEIRIVIDEDTAEDRLSLEVADDGRGMDAEMREKALDPFFTSRTTRRVGLGLPMLAQSARESGGVLELDSAPGRGTTVRAVFQLNHPDRKPLGDIAATLSTIVAGRRDLELLFEYRRNGELLAKLDSRRPEDGESE